MAQKKDKPLKKPSKKTTKAEKPSKKTTKAEKPSKKKKTTGLKITRNAKTATKKGSWSVSDFKAAEYNPRQITDKALEELGASLKRFGDLSGVVVNRFTGNTISGHQRLRTISEYKSKVVTKPVKDEYGTVEEGHIVVKTPEGRIAIPLRIVDWTDKKEFAANIAANAHGGDWNMKLLSYLVAELEESEFDISVVGLDGPTLRSLGHLDNAPDIAKDSSSGKTEFTEFTNDSVSKDLQHTCPKCNYRF